MLYKDRVETVSVPFTSREVTYDTSKGQVAGKNIQGVDGVKEVVYRQRIVNGQVVEETAVGERIVTQPVEAVKYVNVTPAQTAKTVTASAAQQSAAPQLVSDGAPNVYSRALRVKFTAYTYSEDGGMYTSTGKRTQVGYVAVDPRVIPYHSTLYCVTDDGYVYGYCYAEDCGGAIKGNRIDLFLPTLSACYNFGVRMGTCYVVTEG